MLRLQILGSSSSGNCSLVSSGSGHILVDAGFSARQITQRLAAAGVAPESIQGILVTHEHGDHVCGLDVFCRKHSTPVFCNSVTAESLRGSGFSGSFRLFETGHLFEIGGLRVLSFPVPHDAADPVGYVIETGPEDAPRSLGFLTDLGFATKLALERVRRVHTLVIETNHDLQLLQNDLKRPWSVKQRILSRHGHLSNDAAAQLVAEIASAGRLRRVILGHLSKDCNRPELAETAVRKHLDASGISQIEVLCAPPGEPGPAFLVE